MSETRHPSQQEREPIRFLGPCTNGCQHPPDDHGIKRCNIKGCKCTAGWSS